MLKYILFIAVTAVTVPLGYYAWKKYYDVKPIVQTETSIPIEINNNEKTFKDENLHQAFAKILSKEKKKNRRYTIDELILAYRENRVIKMTLEEIKLIIAKLENDIYRDERHYAIAGAKGHDVEDLEGKIVYKKEELENFKLMESQYSGVAIENR